MTIFSTKKKNQQPAMFTKALYFMKASTRRTRTAGAEGQLECAGTWCSTDKTGVFRLTTNTQLHSGNTDHFKYKTFITGKYRIKTGTATFNYY